MSTLLVDEIYSGVVVDQKFTIDRNISISNIRPWIYKHGTVPVGTFELTILEGGNVLKSSTIESSEINQLITSTYAHGSINFNFDSLVLNIPEKETTKEYTMRFTFTGIFDENNHIGLVRRWEAKTYPTYGVGVVSNEAPNDSVEPFGLEIYEYTEHK
jgi:hypothetical protein